MFDPLSTSGKHKKAVTIWNIPLPYKGVSLFLTFFKIPKNLKFRYILQRHSKNVCIVRKLIFAEFNLSSKVVHKMHSKKWRLLNFLKLLTFIISTFHILSKSPISYQRCRQCIFLCTTHYIFNELSQ